VASVTLLSRHAVSGILVTRRDASAPYVKIPCE